MILSIVLIGTEDIHIVHAAGTYINSYNLTGAYSSSGPYQGVIRADNWVRPAVPGAQTIRAENYNIKWRQAQVDYIRRNYSSYGPTFHVGVYNPNNPAENCQAPFSYTGWWRAVPSTGAFVQTRSVWSCYYTGYTNEVRILWPWDKLLAETAYTGEAEFRLNNGDLYFTQKGKVANDIYLMYYNNTLNHELRTNITWCFEQNGTEYQC
jgi:hypothetical protein